MFRRHKPSTLEHKKDPAIQGSVLPAPHNGMKSFFNLSQLVLTAGHLRPLPVLRHSKITYVEVEILDAHSKKQICVVDKMPPSSTLLDVKHKFHKICPQWYPSRIGLRLERNGPYLKDSVNVKSLAASSIITLYFTDMGQQVSWITVFLTEYTGPLLIYLLFYFRFSTVYDAKESARCLRHPVVQAVLFTGDLLLGLLTTSTTPSILLHHLETSKFLLLPLDFWYVKLEIILSTRLWFIKTSQEIKYLFQVQHSILSHGFLHLFPVQITHMSALENMLTLSSL
ncbi:trans-2,3-enoyl-CoA reductase-like isoform X6 [Pantherophis guttatus]|uniref:Trans-2,3-enoyl-CoA reductase-like isoform X6 n=1 Tax=Pantherophis guttatus TaxID=94885 RepID=A0ABM3ZHA0_PANGU|nr:trans-2,3-enoyl-CoA reductase-like isoform X6 [Pantherophis guttatus]